MKALLLKYKFYILGFVVIIALLATIQGQRKSIQKQNDRITRLIHNMDVLLNENVNYETLNLTLKEARNASLLKVDSLAALLKIKPKVIERVVYQTIIQHDTIVKSVFVDKVGVNTWKISDKGDCFTWTGIAKLQLDSLIVNRTGFDYANEATNVFYKHRKYWIFSKWKFQWETLPKCGVFKTTEINIVKK